MGCDGMKVGVQIMVKFVIKPTKICCRLVYDHPLLVGILLMLLCLYRSFPFLFQLLVSASPVIVCTAVLLGTLLSFGDNNISTLIEEDETKTHEISELKTDLIGSRTVVEKSLGEDSEYTELKSEVVERGFDEEPLLDVVDREGKYETHGDLVVRSLPSDHISRDFEVGEHSISEMIEKSFDEEPLLDIVGREGKYETHGDLVINSMPIDYISREVEFGKHSIDEGIDEFVDFDDQKTGIEVDVGSSHEILEERSFAAEKVHSENFEIFKSVEGSTDIHMKNSLESFIASERLVNDISSDVKAYNLENHETDEKSIETPVSERLESSSGSWTQFDVLEDGLSSVKKIQVDNFEDYISGEGSIDAQLGSPLELSLGSWNHLDSDRDVDDESYYGSDGAESSSPDASLADIIPMLDELHPLLEDENPQTVNLSCQDNYHSNDESDHQEEDEEVGDVKSDGDDENEEETQDGKEDRAKSVINWTEEDTKNLMELGTSELERNQRLESLILRRRARRMVSERNLLDLEGMDLSFPIPPISTTRYNPFDNSHDSYGDLGLPPIPGSAPSIMVKRQNPFDLPYDSSEEKPDLTGDSFQEEFMELGQRESVNQRLFKRNETFSAGSSIFDFGRPANRATRFRPYFVPERTDDVMSYSSFERQLSEISESRISNSSFQRQSSELSESKASSASDTDIMYTVGDQDEKKLFEDVGSISDDGNETKNAEHNLPVIELTEVGNSPSTSYTSEVRQPAEMREVDKGDDLEVDYEQSERELSSSEVQFMGELTEINHISSSSLSVPEEHDGSKDEADERGLVNNQVQNFENVDIPVYQSHEEPEFGLGAEADEIQPKEPIYDLSPLATNRNTSSSSICSDLQRETSEIDLYHVQRDLFAENEFKNHDNDAQDNDLQRRQEPDDYQFGDDSSARELLEKELLDDTIPPIEGHHGGKLDASLADVSFEEGNKSSTDHGSSTDSNLSSSEVELKEETGTNISESDYFVASTSSMNNHDNDASKELLFALDEDHFLPHESLVYDPQKQEQPSSQINPKDFNQSNEIGETANVLKVQEPEDNMLSSLLNDESSSQLEKPENTSFSESADEKKVQDIYGTKFASLIEEHNSSTEGLDESVADDLIMSEEITDMKEMDEELLSELDAVGDFSVKNMSLELNKNYLDDEVDSDNPEEAVDEVNFSSGIQFGDSTSVVDMNDAQKFDSIGVSSEPELLSSKDIIVNEGIKKDSEEEVQTFLAKQSVQTEGVIVNEPNIAWSKESIPDLHIRDASIDYLIPEEQSVEYIDAAFKKVTAEEVQKSLASELITVEDTNLSDLNFVLHEELIPDSPIGEANVDLLVGKDQFVEDIDAPLTEVSKEDVQQPMSQVIEEIPLIETILKDKEPVSERSESNRAFWEGHILDSLRKKLELGISVNTEISEMSSKDFEGLETNIDKSIRVEALETNVEPGIGPEESLPPYVNSDIRDLQESPVIGDQIERSGSIDFKLLQPDIDTKKMEDSPVLEACTSNSLEPGDQIERDVNETQELPVLGASIAPFVDFVGQIEGVDFVESQLLTLNVGTNEIRESPVEASSEYDSESKDSKRQIEPESFREPESLLKSPVVEANILHDDTSENQLQKVGHLETQQSKVDRDFEEIQEPPVVEASVLCTIEAKDDSDINSQQKPEVGHLETHQSKIDRDLEGIQKPLVEASAIEAKDDSVINCQHKPEVLVSKSDDSEEYHVVSQSNEKDPNAQGSNQSAPEKSTSQVEEERSHDSHLEFSSSSSLCDSDEN